jgi:subtilase family serine protease
VKFRPAEASARPTFTSGTSGNHFLTPKDVATIYDVNAVYNSGYTGNGQSIAVVGQSEVDVSDIEHFQSAAGLSTKDPNLVLVPNSGSAAYSTGDEAESDLDLEYSGGIAKGSTIYFVYVGNNSNYSVWDSIEYAVDTDISPIISVSYGACETAMSSSDYSTLESYMEQGASQGQSIIVASGDSGSTGCYGDVSLSTEQQEALAVDYPASSAYVTGIGGTEFPWDDVDSSNTTYWESSSGSDVVSSAKSYIPEQAWNDDSSSSGLSSGGGGTSTLTSRPSWQSGVTGISSGSYRLVPDVSLDSSPNNAGYLYCSSDKVATGISGSCSNGFRDSDDKYLTTAGGTSFAAPIFAGMLALINQRKNSTGQGLINKTLYELAADSSTYESAFHDITSGGNECAAGWDYCSSAGASKYYAGTGYDEATGLGSIDLYNLVTAWPSSSSSSLQATTTYFSPTSATIISGASQELTITVVAQSSSTSSTPTGTLIISVDGTKQSSSLSLSSGSASYTFSSTTTGSHVITATYSGDSTFGSSTGTSTISVMSSSGSGGSGSTTVTVTPSAGYTGTVDLTASTTNTYLQNYACYELSNATISSSSAATETLTVYLGSSNCSSSSSVRTFRAASSPKGSSHPASVKKLAAFGYIGLLLAGIIGWRSRRSGVCLGILGLVIVSTFVSGCSGSSSSKTFTVSDSPSSTTASEGSSGIPKGSYAITIEGQDSSKSSLSSSTTLTLTVD